MARRNDPPKPTLVLLVRHGQTPTTGASLPGRAPGLHLAETGIAQAEAAAARIAGLPAVAAVYASPMERTRETAAPIARARKLRVRQAAGLIECDFGRWTGQKLDVTTWEDEIAFAKGIIMALDFLTVGLILILFMRFRPQGILGRKEELVL